ncbi:MAG: hypothetical protein HOB33_00465 [Bacteroidetes Order II. Incertae sedis bacterium]|nr:hypothetical protein [Bacteroidetes Order II. bacterium]
MYRALVIIFLAICYAVPAQAQDPLSLSNDKTTIRGVSFRFTDSRTFTSEQLEARMSSKAPGALFSWRKRLDFLPFIDKKEYPFHPVELQRDVIRLQRFYQRNGFPDAIVDYPASQYRASDNSIRVINWVSYQIQIAICHVLICLFKSFMINTSHEVKVSCGIYLLLHNLRNCNRCV